MTNIQKTKPYSKRDRNLHCKFMKKFKLQIYERKNLLQIKIAYYHIIICSI